MENITIITITIITSLIFSFILAYLIFKHLYVKKIKSISEETTFAVKNIFKDNIEYNSSAHEKELETFHSEVLKTKESFRQKESYRQEVLTIVNSVVVNMDLSDLFEDLMIKILDVTNSNCGAFYLANKATNKLEIKSSLGFSRNIYSEFDLNIGEGILGSAAKSKEVQILREVPEDTVYLVKSFLGEIKPKNIIIIPICSGENLLGILLLSSIFEYAEGQSDIIELIRYYTGIAVSNGISYEKTKRLSNELKFQNTLIQNLNEELEKKVQNRTLFLSNIINSIKDYAIYAMDTNGIVLAFNKGAEIILGYSSEEVVGKHISFIFTPDEVKEGKIQNRIDLARENGKYEENGLRYKKDGKPYYCEMILFAMYDDNNEIIGYTNITKDITYVKNIERALGFEKEFTKKMFDDTSKALIITDLNGVIQSSNSNAEELLQSENLQDVHICNLFLDGDYLKKSLADVSNRFGSGEWRVTIKVNKQSVWFNVKAIMSTGIEDATLFIHLFK